METRRCALEGCETEFTPTTPKQIFCCDGHAKIPYARRKQQERDEARESRLSTVKSCARDGCENIVERKSPKAIYCSDSCNQKAHYYRNHEANMARNRKRLKKLAETGYFREHARWYKAQRIAENPEYKEHLRVMARVDYNKFKDARLQVNTVWRRKNVELRSILARRRRARMKAAKIFLITPRDLERMKRRFNYCCAYCGRKPERLEIEHVIPISRGGDDAIGNILPVCPECNQSKNGRLLIEWRYLKMREAKLLKEWGKTIRWRRSIE